MGVEFPGDWRAAAVAALDWWQEAGVDTLVDDAPRDWLVREGVAAPVAPPPPAASGLPATLAEFLAWRVGDAAPEASWRGVSVAASGPIDAAWMVLVDCPDRQENGGEDCLLGGTAGRLFDRMLAAMGLPRAIVHLAAVCARRPVAGRMPRDVEVALHRLAGHHVGLLAPQRLLVMGDAASRALLGADVLRARGRLHVVNHDGGQTQAVATFHPRLLLERPAQKADAWKDLQLLMGTV